VCISWTGNRKSRGYDPGGHAWEDYLLPLSAYSAWLASVANLYYSGDVAYRRLKTMLVICPVVPQFT
jgi:hypothetical protein